MNDLVGQLVTDNFGNIGLVVSQDKAKRTYKVEWRYRDKPTIYISIEDYSYQQVQYWHSLLEVERAQKRWF